MSATYKREPTGKEMGTLFAVFLIPVLSFLAWVVASIMLWTSDYWTTRDKLIGTLGPPLIPLCVALVGAPVSFANPWQDWARIAMMLSVMLSPLIVGVYLIVRYNQLKPSSGQPVAPPLSA